MNEAAVKVTHDCDGCEAHAPGIRPFSNQGEEHAGRPPHGYVAVERCDTCELYKDDLQAANAWGTEARWQKDNGTSQAIAKPPA